MVITDEDRRNESPDRKAGRRVSARWTVMITVAAFVLGAGVTAVLNEYVHGLFVRPNRLSYGSVHLSMRPPGPPRSLQTRRRQREGIAVLTREVRH